MDFFSVAKRRREKEGLGLGNLRLWKKTTISETSATLHSSREKDGRSPRELCLSEAPLAWLPLQPQLWFELDIKHSQCSSPAQGSPVPPSLGLCHDCFSWALQSCQYTWCHCHMHRDLLTSIPSSFLFACKFNAKISEKKKKRSMGDRPERQTLYSRYPPDQQCFSLSFDGGFEKSCKIWVWIYLSPFLLPTPSPSQACQKSLAWCHRGFWLGLLIAGTRAEEVGSSDWIRNVLKPNSSYRSNTPEWACSPVFLRSWCFLIPDSSGSVKLAQVACCFCEYFLGYGCFCEPC